MSNYKMKGSTFYGKTIKLGGENVKSPLKDKGKDPVFKGKTYDAVEVKDKKDKKKEKWLKRKNLYLTGSEDEEGIHKPVKPGILKKRLGKLSCSKVRGAKGKLKDKGTHYAKALQRYLNYHC